MTAENAPVASSAADPHGQAAILLTETLIHALITRRIIDVAEAVEIVESAAEVGAAVTSDGVVATDVSATGILTAIAASLRLDLPGD